METEGKKYWFEAKGKCPACGKRVLIRVKKEVITPAVKAVVETKTAIEADDQTTLDEVK